MSETAFVLVTSLTVSVVYLTITAAAALVLALRAGGRREIRTDDHDVLSESRFTMPVSLIVRFAAPLRTSIERSHHTLAALLALNYPELEVIVVAEDLSAAEWTSLKGEWQLGAREFFYRQALTTAPVRMVYRSARDPRLMIVDKTAGGEADALNCGVNLARFRYVCAIEPALVFDADALLRAMAAPMRDPAAVVGATSHVEIGSPSMGSRSAGVLQRLASLRAIMESRLVWKRLRFAFAPRERVVVWRRDAIVQSGGFSPAAADADLDMMVRVQTSTTPGVAGRVVRTAEIFGGIEPGTFAEHFRATARRQRAAVSAIGTLTANPRTCGVAMLYLIHAEVLTPLAQAWLVVGAAAGAAAGWLSWQHIALAVVLVSFGRASLGAAALLLRGSLPDGPEAHAAYGLLLAAPVEAIVDGAAAAGARVAGSVASVTSVIAAPPSA